GNRAGAAARPFAAQLSRSVSEFLWPQLGLRADGPGISRRWLGRIVSPPRTAHAGRAAPDYRPGSATAASPGVLRSPPGRFSGIGELDSRLATTPQLSESIASWPRRARPSVVPSGNDLHADGGSAALLHLRTPGRPVRQFRLVGHLCTPGKPGLSLAPADLVDSAGPDPAGGRAPAPRAPQSGPEPDGPLCRPARRLPVLHRGHV